ncbi:MAG: NAD(P)-dependent alcohol dehydrogenase [Alphaproteobacteria bacterium]|nr:NAD(P)-dependent alcohol dehydrogenase [Alphaproteobacteria bacterium]
MKAYLIPKPTGIDALTLVERPTPRPGPRQVRVRIKACSLNYRDLMVVRGAYARGPLPENIVPLSDGAGTVVEVGPGVTRVKVGDRVAGCFFQRWYGGSFEPTTNASALGGSIDGVLAEEVVLEEEGVVEFPDHLSFAEAATLPCAALTAWNALIEHGRLTAGETILVQGTGGVSIFALQFARQLGARVIATSSSDAKLARVKSLGADAGVNYKSRVDWDVAATEITAGRGVDQVIEVGGAGTFARSLNAIRVGGKISLIGLLAGAAEINPMPILRKLADVRGIFVGSAQMFEAMNRAIASARLKPAIDRVFPFADAKAAYRHLESGAHFGKIVIELS